MRFQLEHPNLPGARCRYGFDHALGFWAEARGAGMRADYDRLNANYRGLDGALAFIAGHGFLRLDDLQVGLLLTARGEDRQLTELQQRAVDIVGNFKRLADL